MKLLAAFVRAAALASRRRSATSMAAIEVERKYAALCAGDELRERLAAAGANLQSEASFRDTYFDGDDFRLTRADTWLRRRERAWELKVPFAEGAGAEHFDGIDLGKDPSGNKRLPDIGTLLKDRTKAFWAAKGRPIEVRLIDPSYQVRLGPAIVSDECMHMCLHA